jgi:hypothetical protein
VNHLINTSTWTQSFLWASVIWGAIGGGYTLYGWRQKAMIPFAAGLVMSVAACFVPALPMTLISLAAIFGAHWLLRHGY